MARISERLQNAAARVRTFVAREKVLTVGLSVAVALACVGGVLFAQFSHSSHVVIGKAIAPSSSVVSSASSVPLPSKKAEILAAKQKNADVTGWLTVPGTDLDMAVTHTTNNSYYLTHNLAKESYKKGWPFLDYRNDGENLGRNSIIYGHNMGDGALFGELKRYEDLNFLNQHPVIYFGSADTDRYWKIFAVYITDVNFYYINTDFPTDGDFTSLVSQMRAQSMFNTDVDVTATDKVLTLSTCTYEFNNARFVIEARLVRPGESYDVTPASKNANSVSPHHKASKS